MKRFLTALAAAALSVALLAGCAKPNGNQTPSDKPDTPDVPAATDEVKTGLYVETSYAGTTGAADGADGLAKVQVTLVALTVDAENRIDGLMIDQVQGETGFDGAGGFTGTPADSLSSKNELGAQYGMAASSSIGKEWNEQMRAFERYCIGKTVEELKAISFDEAGKPTNPDLAASVTLSTGYFINYIEAAANSAQPLGAMRGDAVSVAASGGQGGSTGAQGGENGYVRTDLAIAALTTASDGRITSCILDGLKADLVFGAGGALVTDLGERPKTKNELGDEYGMAKASSIGKEWYEQAASLAAYVTGKTADEVEGIAMDEGGMASEPDLRASVTISIAQYVPLVARAARMSVPQGAGETAQNG